MPASASRSLQRIETNSSIAVMDQPALSRLAGPERLLQRVEHEVRFRRARDFPADDSVGVDIDGSYRSRTDFIPACELGLEQSVQVSLLIFSRHEFSIKQQQFVLHRQRVWAKSLFALGACRGSLATYAIETNSVDLADTPFWDYV